MIGCGGCTKVAAGEKICIVSSRASPTSIVLRNDLSLVLRDDLSLVPREQNSFSSPQQSKEVPPEWTASLHAVAASQGVTYKGGSWHEAWQNEQDGRRDDGPAALLAVPYTSQGPSANLISITDKPLPVIPYIPGDGGIQIDSSLPGSRGEQPGLVPDKSQNPAFSTARRLIDQSSQKMDKGLLAVMKYFVRTGGADHVAKQSEYIQKTLNPIMQPLLENLLIVLPAEPLLFVVIWLRKRVGLEVDAEACARAGRSKYRDLQDILAARQESALGSVDDDKATLRAVYQMYIEYELNPLIEKMTSSCVCKMPPDAAQFLLDFVEHKVAQGDAPECVVS